MKRIDTVSSEATAVEVSVKGAGRGTYKTATYTAEVTVFDPPDGGWQAWTVVFASALALFSSFGVVNSYVSRTVHKPYLPSLLYAVTNNNNIHCNRAYSKVTTATSSYQRPPLHRSHSSVLFNYSSSTA